MKDRNGEDIKVGNQVIWRNAQSYKRYTLKMVGKERLTDSNGDNWYPYFSESKPNEELEIVKGI